MVFEFSIKVSIHSWTFRGYLLIKKTWLFVADLSNDNINMAINVLFEATKTYL